MGVFYVGGTRYAAREPGQPEACEITPIEPVYDLATAVCSNMNLRNVSAEEWCKRRVA